jgi:hypothetical protein
MPPAPCGWLEPSAVPASCRAVCPWRSGRHETYGAPMQRGQAADEGAVSVAHVNGPA